MSKSLFIILIIAAMPSMAFKNTDQPAAARTYKVSVSFVFKGIVEGYDHDSKTELYIDDNLVATSEVKKESQKNSVSANITKGKHSIKIINYAFYDNEWQVHNKENDYSIDALYEEDINVKKKNTSIELVFDIDNGTSRVK